MAIQANELRIGNWFIDWQNKLFQFSLDDFALIAKAGIEIGELIKNPIPLTSEILEMAGFKHFTQNWYEKSFNSTSISIDVVRGTIDIAQSSHDVVQLNIKLELHILQNLWFALSSEELQVNLSHVATTI